MNIKLKALIALAAIAIALISQAEAQNNPAVVAWGSNGSGQSTVPGGL